MGAATGQAPFKRSFFLRNPDLSAGSSDELIVCTAPFTGVLEAAYYIPEAAITGQNTNTRKLTVYNRKQDGSGTTVMAQLQFDSGVNASAKVRKAITLSGTATNLDVATGDVIAFASDAVGTGLADPGGTVELVFSRD